MRPYMNKKDYEYFEHGLNTNYQGMDHLNKKIYCKMFGFKTHDELI